MPLPKPKLPNPFREFPKPPKLSQIILKKANPVREVIDNARQLIKVGKSEISEIASALRVEKPAETMTPPTETEGKQEESAGCAPCQEMHSLKEFLGKRKVKRALSELEKGEGSKKSLETVRQYIEGEEVE